MVVGRYDFNAPYFHKTTANTFPSNSCVLLIFKKNFGVTKVVG